MSRHAGMQNVSPVVCQHQKHVQDLEPRRVWSGKWICLICG